MSDPRPFPPLGLVSVDEVREALGDVAAEYSDLELAQIAGMIDRLAGWVLLDEAAAAERPAA